MEQTHGALSDLLQTRFSYILMFLNNGRGGGGGGGGVIHFWLLSVSVKVNVSKENRLLKKSFV